MAIAFDAASNANNSGNTTWTFSHTCTGSDRLLLIGCAIQYGDTCTISGITYNGVSMTRIGSAINNTDSFSNIGATAFYLIAPATGTNTVSVSLTGPPFVQGVAAISLTGVHQTTPLGTHATAFANNSSAPSVTVSSATDEFIVDFVAMLSNPTSTTAGSGQTKRTENLASDSSICSSTEAGAASVVMDWSLGGNQWCSIFGIPVKPSGGGATWTPRVIGQREAARRSSIW